MTRRLAALFAAALTALAFAPTGSAATAQALPEHQLTGYWQNFVNNAKPLKVSDISANYDLMALAFGNADPSRPGAVTFTVDPQLSSALGGYSDEQLTADIAAKKAEGKTFVLSTGGEKGTSTWAARPTSRTSSTRLEKS
jgi:chitinase